MFSRMLGVVVAIFSCFLLTSCVRLELDTSLTPDSCWLHVPIACKDPLSSMSLPKPLPLWFADSRISGKGSNCALRSAQLQKICEQNTASPEARVLHQWAVVPDVCWIRMPTGCTKKLRGASSPNQWFVDPKLSVSIDECSSRVKQFNAYCRKDDGITHFGGSPPRGESKHAKATRRTWPTFDLGSFGGRDDKSTVGYSLKTLGGGVQANTTTQASRTSSASTLKVSPAISLKSKAQNASLSSDQSTPEEEELQPTPEEEKLQTLVRYINPAQEETFPSIRPHIQSVSVRPDGDEPRLATPFEHVCGGNAPELNESLGNDGPTQYLSFSNADHPAYPTEECTQPWDKGGRRVKTSAFAVRQQGGVVIDMSSFRQAKKWCYEGGCVSTASGEELCFIGAKDVEPWPYLCAQRAYHQKINGGKFGYSIPDASWWTLPNRKLIAASCATWAKRQREVLILPNLDKVTESSGGIVVKNDRYPAKELCTSTFHDRCVTYDPNSSTACCCSQACSNVPCLGEVGSRLQFSASKAFHKKRNVPQVKKNAVTKESISGSSQQTHRLDAGG